MKSKISADHSGTDMRTSKDSFGYYKDLLAKGSEFDQQDQGECMTALRHRFVCNQLQRLGSKVVLDYGCGTGLTLLNPSMPSKDIALYVGADFLEERRAKFKARLSWLGMSGDFELVVPDARSYLTQVADLCSYYSPDTLVLCGLVGYEGFTDLEEIVTVCRKAVMNTVMTVPTTTSRLPTDTISRYSVESLKGLFNVCEELHSGLHGVVI